MWMTSQSKLSVADQDLRLWKGRIIMIYGTLIVMPFVILIVTMLVVLILIEGLTVGKIAIVILI